MNGKRRSFQLRVGGPILTQFLFPYQTKFDVQVCNLPDFLVSLGLSLPRGSVIMRALRPRMTNRVLHQSIKTTAQELEVADIHHEPPRRWTQPLSQNFREMHFQSLSWMHPVDLRPWKALREAFTFNAAIRSVPSHNCLESNPARAPAGRIGGNPTPNSPNQWAMFDLGFCRKNAEGCCVPKPAA